MAIGDVLEYRVERLASGGAAVARVDGKAVFTELAAPQDLVRARVVEDSATFSRAEVEKILEASPLRVQPPCPHFGTCGGCSWQHLAYEAQTAAKSALLAEAFQRIGGFAVIPPIKTVPSLPYGYRNRMQFHRVANRRSAVSPVGFMRRLEDAVLPVDDCPVADARIRAALAARELVPPVQLDRFNVFARGDLLLVEGSAERGVVELRGKKLRMDVRGFFQSNVAALEGLLDELMEVALSAERDLRAADLYCGVGTFAAFLSDLFPRLDLVERDKTALALACQNVRGQGIRHFAISDDEWARNGSKGGQEPYGFAVVDPPRVGLSAGLRNWLARMKVGTLAYVSCDPSTLARDAKDLVAAGYALRSLSCHDFYPQTHHIETLAVFGCDAR